MAAESRKAPAGGPVAAVRPAEGLMLQEQGKEHLKTAMRLESDGSGAQALCEYKLGLDKLMRCMKSTQSEKKRENLRRIIAAYVTRAENLKTELQKEPRPQQRGSMRDLSRPHSVSSATTKAKRSAVGSDSARDRQLAEQERKLREQIEGEIMEVESGVTFNDVAGLHDVKQALFEMVILPAMRPDIFHGLRAPPKGLLLFGPPGNGKTLIAQAVASQVQATFYNISASSLTSKFMGESEKLVRALFASARERQPSVIFIDEIDSILAKRSAEDHEASRRLKTEFMVQFNTLLGSDNTDRVIVIGATNLPELLDDAVIRRLSKRIYVGAPDRQMRRELMQSLLKDQVSMSNAEWNRLVDLTECYSGSDLRHLCQDAAMGPVRELGPKKLSKLDSREIPRIAFHHFEQALRNVPPSVTKARLKEYEQWGREHKVAMSASAADDAADSKSHVLSEGEILKQRQLYAQAVQEAREWKQRHDAAVAQLRAAMEGPSGFSFQGIHDFLAQEEQQQQQQQRQRQQGPQSPHAPPVAAGGANIPLGSQNCSIS